MTHYQMTLAEHETARGSYVDPDRYKAGHRDYMPEMLCRTGDGHAYKDATRDWSKVTCLDCLAKHFSSRVRECAEFAARIKALGFTVWLAKSHDYGFITDDSAARVLSFSFTDWSLGGNYGPPSKTSGTGWRMEQSPGSLTTAQAVRDALYSHAPRFCGDGWKYYTTVAQHIGQYGSSSGYYQA